MYDQHCVYTRAFLQACAPIPSGIVAECKQHFFNQDHPACGLEDGSRWMHVCQTVRMVFAVLVGYSCPYCKEAQHDELADRIEGDITSTERQLKKDAP